MILCPEGAVSNELTPNRDKIERIRRILLMLWVIQSSLAALNIILSFWLCLCQIISSLVLYLAITQLNYCNCVVYIVISFFNFIGVLYFLVNRVCDERLMKSDTTNLKLTFSFLTIGYYSFALPIIFYAYKHFKDMVYQMLLSQTSYEQDCVTKDSQITINGFQQTLTIADLENEQKYDSKIFQEEEDEEEEEEEEEQKNENIVLKEKEQYEKVYQEEVVNKEEDDQDEEEIVYTAKTIDVKEVNQQIELEVLKHSVSERLKLKDYEIEEEEDIKQQEREDSMNQIEESDAI